MSSGWVPSWRKMYEPGHWLAPTRRDPSNRRDAWSDLFHMATRKRRQTPNSGTLEVGELVASLRTLGDRWCWSKDRVKRFMSDLEVRTAVETVRETPDGTVYRIVEYGTYAIVRDSERDTGSDSERDRGETAARQEQQRNKKLLPPLSPKTGSRKVALPDEWQPTEQHGERARAEGVDVDREVIKFRNHALGNGRKQIDWDRAFTTWLLRAGEYQRERTPANQPKPRYPTLDASRMPWNQDGAA